MTQGNQETISTENVSKTTSKLDQSKLAFLQTGPQEDSTKEEKTVTKQLEQNKPAHVDAQNNRTSPEVISSQVSPTDRERIFSC